MPDVTRLLRQELERTQQENTVLRQRVAELEHSVKQYAQVHATWDLANAAGLSCVGSALTFATPNEIRATQGQPPVALFGKPVFGAPGMKLAALASLSSEIPVLTAGVVGGGAFGTFTGRTCLFQAVYEGCVVDVEMAEFEELLDVLYFDSVKDEHRLSIGELRGHILTPGKYTPTDEWLVRPATEEQKPIYLRIVSEDGAVRSQGPYTLPFPPLVDAACVDKAALKQVWRQTPEISKAVDADPLGDFRPPVEWDKEQTAHLRQRLAEVAEKPLANSPPPAMFLNGLPIFFVDKLPELDTGKMVELIHRTDGTGTLCGKRYEIENFRSDTLANVTCPSCIAITQQAAAKSPVCLTCGKLDPNHQPWCPNRS